MSLVGRPLKSILAVLLALTASGIMFCLIDGNLAAGPMHNVVRNWEQYGLFALEGKLVTNPGGYEALSQPHVHKGHRPVSLYAAFFTERLFSWAGAGALAFHIALSLALLLSIWFLLGKSRIAWLAGAAAIVCPGYVCYQTILCPVAIPVLMGLPFAAVVLPLLFRPSLSLAALAALLFTIATYSTLNWSAVFVHGTLLAYLIVGRQISTRRAWLYIAAAGVSLALVAGLSVLNKQGGASFRGFLGGYLWGSGGYGTHLTTDRAVVRLLFVGTVGLLPMLLVCSYLLAQYAKGNPERSWTVLSPLGIGVIGIGIMRNYFGVQPWMATPVFLAGIVLSMRLMVEGKKATPAAEGRQLGGEILAPAAFLAGCFAYGALVIIMARLHQNPDFHALVALARNHTVRSDTIVLLDADPRLASIATTVAECVDRRVVLLNDLSAWEQIHGRAFLLSTSGEARLHLVGRTSQPPLVSCRLVQKLLALYRTIIARRLPGDQGFAPGTCYLYKLTNNIRAANIQMIPGKLAGPM
jgi:hypothetical protein